MQKKGQVTIYVIVGMIVLILMILLVSVRQNIFITGWDQERQDALLVPENVQEVRDFMLECVEKTGQDAINLMGLQGGYIDIPEDWIPPSPNNPFSNSLLLFQGQDFKTPYWFYKSANGLLKYNIPKKENMEVELANYMNTHLAICTLNFTIFEEFNIDINEINSKAEIRDNRVLFTVDQPLTVNIQDFTFRFPKFYQDIDSNLGQLYGKAKEMLENMKENYYLEDFTIDILSVNKNIPFSDTETSCVPKFWNMGDIEREIKTDLEANIPHIKVDGTNYGKVANYFVWDLLNENNDNLHIDFRYSQNWPISIEAFPSKGGVLTAAPFGDPTMEELAFVSSFLCIIDYNFIYDITYPVLISLYDDTGFVFQFANHVIIDNNQPRVNELGVDDYPDEESKICDSAVNSISVNVLNSETYQSLNGADIKLKCISTVCDLGKTEVTNLGSVELSTLSPACFNALLTAEKDGYHKGREIVDTTDSGQFTIFMDPFREFDYKIILVEESGYARPPEKDETVIITLNEIQKKYGVNAMKNEGKLKLIPGDYKYQAYVSKESSSGFYIEGKEFNNCVELPQQGLWGAFFGEKEEHCYSAKSDGVTLNQAIIGGAKFDWSLVQFMMDGKSKMTLYVPVWKTPVSQDDILRIQENVEGGRRITFPEFE